MNFRSWNHAGALTAMVVIVGGAAGSSLAGAPAFALPPTKDADSRVAEGDVTFDCILQPFGSAFRFTGTVAIVAPLAVSEGVPSQVSGTFTDLPGIAPVPIEDGTMHVTATGTVDGAEVVLKATSTVNVAPKADVAVPRLTGEVMMDADEAAVELSTFGFAFDKMMGIDIAAECEATQGGDLGTMSTGDGATPSSVKAKDRQALGVDSGSTGDDGLPGMLLWAAPLGVLVIGLVFVVARRLPRNP